MNEKVIFVVSQIDTVFLERFLFVLKEKIQNDCIKIHVMIQSKGGSVPIALAIGRLLKNLNVPVTTYNMGNVDSAAVMIFAGGQERLCFPQSSFALHPLSQDITGVKSSDEFKAILHEIESDTARVTDFLAEQTNISSDEWRRRMNARQHLNVKDSVEIGLATGVLSEYPEALKSSWEIF